MAQANALDFYSPEAIQQLMRLAAIDDENQMLMDQIAAARELRKGGGEQYYGDTGAALGALANVVNAGVGGYQEMQARDAQKKNQQEQAKIREMQAQLYADELRKRKAQEEAQRAAQASQNADIPALLRRQSESPSYDTQLQPWAY